jgi:hypothetical protein
VKKWLLLLIVIAAAFVVYNRQRLFLRDPLGSLTRDGVKEKGAQIFINYSNDVLIENDNEPMYMTLVQHGQPIGSPNNIKCAHYMICMTDADVATMSAVAPGAKIESMSNKVVKFRGGDGREAVVTLR